MNCLHPGSHNQSWKGKKKRSFKSLPSPYNHTNTIGPSRHHEGNFILHNKDFQLLPQPLAMVLLTYRALDHTAFSSFYFEFWWQHSGQSASSPYEGFTTHLILVHSCGNITKQPFLDVENSSFLSLNTAWMSCTTLSSCHCNREITISFLLNFPLERYPALQWQPPYLSQVPSLLY